jgi:hypothetical protein
MMQHALSLLPPGAPWWLTGLVFFGLALHIGGGTAGILAGWGAATTAKGGRRHILFGRIFVAAMLTMAAAALTLAIYLGQRSNIAAALLASYLVMTGWRAARNRDGRVGAPEYAGLAMIAAIALLFLGWGIEGSRLGKLEGYSPVFFHVFAGIAGFFALIDLRVLVRGALEGRARIARHLWRMCFAFFFASGSFFLGQQKVMPASWHGAAVLYVLALAPLGFLVFWLIRVRFAPWRARLTAQA